MKNLLQRILHKAPQMVLFGLLFAILGSMLPDIYFQYFDTRDYYRINSAIVMTKQTKKCGHVEILFDRESDITLQGQAVTEYVLVRVDKIESEQQHTTQMLSMNKGKSLIVANFNLDCTLISGNYFLRGTVRYNVRGGIHLTEWKSDTFLVE